MVGLVGCSRVEEGRTAVGSSSPDRVVRKLRRRLGQVDACAVCAGTTRRPPRLRGRHRRHCGHNLCREALAHPDSRGNSPLAEVSARLPTVVVSRRHIRLRSACWDHWRRNEGACASRRRKQRRKTHQSSCLPCAVESPVRHIPPVPSSPLRELPVSCDCARRDTAGDR